MEATHLRDLPNPETVGVYALLHRPRSADALDLYLLEIVF